MRFSNLLIFISLFILICIVGVNFISFVSAVGTYPAIDPNMVLYYHFNNQSAFGENNTNIYDYSGNGNNGTANNTEFQPNTGILNDGSMYFNGVNSSINTGNSSSLSLEGSNATICAWVLSNSSTKTGYIYSKSNNSVKGYSMIVSYIGMQTSKPDGTLLNIYYTGITTDNWHYICLEFLPNATGTSYVGYLDGDLYSYPIFVEQSYSKNNLNATLGNRLQGSLWFNGSIDEVIIYNRSLTDLQIKTNYINYYYNCITNPKNNCYFLGNNVLSSNINLNNMHIINDNTVLDCNGYNITGTSNYNYNGVFVYANNVTIKNCFFSNYSGGISDNSTNSLFYNNTFLGMDRSIFSDYPNYPINTSISNNIFYNVTTSTYYGDSIVYSNGSNISVFNNYFNSCKHPFVSYGISNFYVYNNYLNNSGIGYILNGNNFSFYNNVINNVSNTLFLDLHGNIGNVNITNNSFLSHDFLYSPSPSNHQTKYINFDYSLNNSNILIQNNIFSNDSLFIVIYNLKSNNVSINNNLFKDVQGNQDGYNVGILTGNSNNINISHNNFSNFGCAGIVSINLSDSRIFNNSFYFDYSWNVLHNIDCQLEPITAIDLPEIYKTYRSFGGELFTDNISILSGYHSFNINISNNVFTGVPVLLKTQGIVNLSHDFFNYWEVSYQTPTFLVDKTDLYNSNQYNNLTTTFNDNNGQPIILTDVLGEGYKGFSPSDGRYFIYFKVYKNYLFFQNVNLTQTYGIIFFNQTNALLIFSNTSSSYFSGVTNQNISLNLNEWVYVFDQFNITIGVQRDNSPYNVSTGKVTGSSNIVNLPTYNLNSISNGVLTDGTQLSNINSTLVILPNNQIYVA